MHIRRPLPLGHKSCHAERHASGKKWINVIWFISLRLQLQADEVRMQDWEEAEKAYGEASD